MKLEDIWREIGDEDWRMNKNKKTNDEKNWQY